MSTPNVSSSCADDAAISAIAASKASAFSGRRCAVAADLADELAGGRLQLTGRRGLVGATQGLDASAHGGRVHRVGGTVGPRWTGHRATPLPSPDALVLARGAAGVALALVIDVVRTGGPSAWLARHHLAPPYEASGQRFDIGRRALYLDCRGEGAPTVVLEAGSGSDSSTWSAVLDALAETTRTCAYDRAGRGRSDPIERHTLPSRGRRAPRAAGRPRARRRRSWSSATRLAVRSSACSRRRTGRRSSASSWSTRSTRTCRTDWIHPLLGHLRAEYEATLDGLRATVAACRFARLGGERSAASRGIGRGAPDRVPRRASLRAAPDRGDERRDRGGVGCCLPVALARRTRSPDDRVGRRPQRPDRPARPGHRGGAAAGRGGSRTWLRPYADHETHGRHGDAVLQARWRRISAGRLLDLVDRRTGTRGPGDRPAEGSISG